MNQTIIVRKMNIRVLILCLFTLLTWRIDPVFAKTPIEWDPAIYPENQLFPSMLLSTATVQLPEEAFSTWEGNALGDKQGSVGITAEGVPKGAKVEVLVQQTGYFRASKYSGTVTNGKGLLLIHPKIQYYFEVLAKIKQAVPLDVTMEFKVDGVSYGEKTQTITMRPVNDCLFSVEEEANEGEEAETSDYSWLFAAYVNEDHPSVDKLLRAGLKLGIVDAFTGMQSEDADEELQQIFAIWCVLRKRGIQYSDITTNSRESQTVFSQTVRFLDESMASSQANCVDGSVLIASVLRKIGLKPSLVLVPGHMFLSVELDGAKTIGIETTMLGNDDDSEADFSRFPKSDLEAPEGFEDSWDNFKAAVSSATSDLRKFRKRFKEAGEDGFDPSFQVIDIAAARALGILPIAR